MQNVCDVYFAAARFVIPIAAAVFVFFAGKAVLKYRKPTILARLVSNEENPKLIDIYSNECVIGSTPLCDVRLSGVADRHAVICKTDEGFELSPLADNISVNGENIAKPVMLFSGINVAFGENSYKFLINKRKYLPSGEKSTNTLVAAVFLVMFQLLVFLYILLKYAHTMPLAVIITALAMFVIELCFLGIKKATSSQSTILFGFFLSTVGLMAASAGDGSRFVKIAIFIFAGFICFLVLRFFLKYPKFCRKIRYPIGILACALMLYNGFFGTYINGAKNWIYIGDNISFQPSELIKAVFIFCSAALMNELITKRNFCWFAFLTLFFGFCLALMRDFGTASIYFVTALIILSMRVKRRRTIYLMLLLALIGGIVIINVMPHVSARFAVYGNVWDYAYEGGYQQTRTMIAIASGGLFGLGGANGTLIYVSAADTDLVFGVICEEWGLLLGICVAASLCILLISCVKSINFGASSFYSVAGCAASGLYLFQSALNIFGSVDILPLTGVALPFISNGGSAMIASWSLLAFVHAYLETCERGECVE